MACHAPRCDMLLEAAVQLLGVNCLRAFFSFQALFRVSMLLPKRNHRVSFVPEYGM